MKSIVSYYYYYFIKEIIIKLFAWLLDMELPYVVLTLEYSDLQTFFFDSLSLSFKKTPN